MKRRLNHLRIPYPRIPLAGFKIFGSRIFRKGCCKDFLELFAAGGNPRKIFCRTSRREAPGRPLSLRRREAPPKVGFKANGPSSGAISERQHVRAASHNGGGASPSFLPSLTSRRRSRSRDPLCERWFLCGVSDVTSFTSPTLPWRDENKIPRGFVICF